MASLFEQRPDGSTALFINGDLQFDSHDEFIYHEALALPALAIAQGRSSSNLRVLIVGGGDGLVTRELFKHSRIGSVDLVDYDPEILALAKRDLLSLNKSSLLDNRVTTHVKDAWEFVDELIERGARFDLIISDLTVAEDIEGARFHSIEWYNRLNTLLTGTGVLAVNAVSPQATPKAYWSIFNGMLRAGLHARPYHVHIPSFSALGYGQDWGFFVASAQPIAFTDLSNESLLLESTKFLKTVGDIGKLFIFPEEIFAFQRESVPALAGSDVLLRYFNNRSSLSETSGAVRDSFSLDTFNIATPEPDSGCDILSPELSAALAASIYANQDFSAAKPENAELILHRVLDLVPSLGRENTEQLISDFLQQPEIFLAAIDLPGLVSRLLRRAAELPACLVAELELLREKLEEWAGDHLTLLSLGSRIVTVLTLTIIIGNVLFPDMAYAKEAHGSHAAQANHAARNAGARRRVGGVYGNRYWTGTGWANRTIVNKRVINNTTVKKSVPSLKITEPPLKNSLPQRNDVSEAPELEKTYSVQTSSVAEFQSQQLMRAANATQNKLLADKQALVAHLTVLSNELADFERSGNSMVTFGSRELPRAEAIRLTKLACRRTEEQIELLNDQIARLPEQFSEPSFEGDDVGEVDENA